ncbi:insulin-like peptide INSL5 [Chanos chanos]|uniref:Insulin-like peptide INSL5 n=1 Tax=Chanos chanos TaxID=29144 RepID=A0A6J2WUB5_CHACN|nr:relaxin-3-like [Chanos chanos]
MRALRSALPVLSVVVLCLLCEVSWAQAEGKAVKLCGREFIRAVVYTCGGSRWRRLLNQQEIEGLSVGEQSSAEVPDDSFSSELTGRDLNHMLTRRDLNHMLTNVCCQVGCRKSDLTFLC